MQPKQPFIKNRWCGCSCIFCPPPPRKLRKCWLRKMYRAHQHARAWYERRGFTWPQRVHLTAIPGFEPEARLQQFAGWHGWIDVRPLEIREENGKMVCVISDLKGANNNE